MAPKTPPDPRSALPAGCEFADLDLSGARFVRCDLSGAVLRAVDVDGASIDAPWLGESGAGLRVNDVEVDGYVEAELNRRFPGRELRTSRTPAELAAAWRAVTGQWQRAMALAAGLPSGAVEQRVDGEWSFAQTLRHLVMATDTWYGRGILGLPPREAYHRIGVPNHEYALDGYDMRIFDEPAPSYARACAVRAERQGQVAAFIARADPARLQQCGAHPWAPELQVSAGSCLRTMLTEEWEHLRFAVRDLQVLGAGPW